ncbi:MAG TPA: hypothetical protein VF541_08845 [Longimicrobium sp.]
MTLPTRLTSGGGSLEVQARRGHVSEALPEPRVLAADVPLEVLPLTPDNVGGKPLPAPAGDADARRGCVEQVGRWDDFCPSLPVPRVIGYRRARGPHAEAGAQV